MAPEQIECKPTDQRTDLYALGCLLYQMIAGVPPFTGANISAVLTRHVNATAAPLPATTPPALAAIVSQLMEKDPAQRIPSAAAVRAALLTVEGSVTLGATALSQAYTPPVAAVTAPAGASATRLDLPPRRSRRLAVVAVAGLAVAAVVVAIASSSSHTTAPSDAASHVVIDSALSIDTAIATNVVIAPDAAVDAPVDATPDAAIKRRQPPPRVVVDASDEPGFIKPDP
jgi:serine/threonine-protein kinase